METDTLINQEPKTSVKPQVFIEKLVFNDGKELLIDCDSIVVFTGANNCGKSQVLKDIETSICSGIKASLIVLEGTDVTLEGDIWAFKDGKIKETPDGGYILENGYKWDKRYMDKAWQAKALSHLTALFVTRMDTESRLTVSKTQNSFDAITGTATNPIQRIFLDDEKEQEISNYFYSAFGVNLIVDVGGGTKIPLFVGERPHMPSGKDRVSKVYREELIKLPILDNQGDGMRSFASILLDTFTSERNITLIDEPEAFLHPPQARLLGKMLAKNGCKKRQLFISTHSEDFLQGLLDADNENVKIIRINRIDNINYVNILENNEIKRLWSNPLLRYSNILRGLFHSKVVVCESDYDCLFYKAVLDSIYEIKGETAPDILFTHCGGKQRMKTVVSALVAVDVPIVAVPDFDIINDSGEFKPLISSFGIDWNNHIGNHMKEVYDWLNANQSIKDNIKRQGKNGLDGNAIESYRQVEQICNSSGLFIVPCGEIECFNKNNKSKADWVYSEILKPNFATDPVLNDARAFVQSFVDYQRIRN